MLDRVKRKLCYRYANAVLCWTLHFAATPSSSYLQGFDLEVCVVDWGQAHKQTVRPHTHQKMPNDNLTLLSRLSQNLAQLFSSSHFIYLRNFTRFYVGMDSFWVTFIIWFQIYYNRYDKNSVRGFEWCHCSLFLVVIQHRMWLVDHRLKLWPPTAWQILTCISVTHEILLLSVSIEIVEQKTSHTLTTIDAVRVVRAPI